MTMYLSTKSGNNRVYWKNVEEWMSTPTKCQNFGLCAYICCSLFVIWSSSFLYILFLICQYTTSVIINCLIFIYLFTNPFKMWYIWKIFTCLTKIIIFSSLKKSCFCPCILPFVFRLDYVILLLWHIWFLLIFGKITYCRNLFYETVSSLF